MAKGRTTRRLVVLSALSAYTLLVVAGIAPNPLPGIWAWLDRERPLAPDLVWQERVGSRPAAAATAGSTVTVAAGGNTQVRDRGTGALVGPRDDQEWSADFALAAGDSGNAVVITGSRVGGGYEVRDPGSGRVIHQDEDAVAVWTFRDAWLDLRCDSRRACQLRSYRPASTDPVWATDLPGRRSGMLGANPELASARTARPNRIEPGVSGPPPLPPLLGFPMEGGDGDLVAVVDTRTGQVRQEIVPAQGERVMVAGGRVIRSTVVERHGVCLASATGHDPVTGAPVWGPEPYRLWTGGSGCEQRVPPLGAGSALVAVSPEGQPMVIDGYDGRVLWTGDPEEDVETLSPELAVIRAADRTTRYGVVLGDGDERLWERAVDEEAGVALAPCGVVVSDRDPSRVYVWDPVTGDQLVSVPTSARVLACGPDGLLIADGRSVGFAAFPGTPIDPDLPPEAK